MAAILLGKVKIENTSNIYSFSGYLKFEFMDKDQKHMIYKQFVAFSCNGCSTAPQ